MRKPHWPFVGLLTFALVACGTSGPVTVAVNGTLRGSSGAPLTGPNVRLQVNHGAPIETTAAGAFSGGTVNAPYTLTIKNGSSVIEYVDMTVAPTQTADNAVNGALRITSVGGQVTPVPSSRSRVARASS